MVYLAWLLGLAAGPGGLAGWPGWLAWLAGLAVWPGLLGSLLGRGKPGHVRTESELIKCLLNPEEKFIKPTEKVF